MTALESRLIERLKVLPPERVAEVVDFVEFLCAPGNFDQRFLNHPACP